MVPIWDKHKQNLNNLAVRIEHELDRLIFQNILKIIDILCYYSHR